MELHHDRRIQSPHATIRTPAPGGRDRRAFRRGTWAGWTQRPNILLIMTDDVGCGDIGAYGAPDVKTPNSDGLAREGVRLTDFYANGATCTPTRAGGDVENP